MVNFTSASSFSRSTIFALRAEFSSRMAIGSWVFDISAVMFVNCKITTNMCFSALGLTSYVCSGAQRSFHV